MGMGDFPGILFFWEGQRKPQSRAPMLPEALEIPILEKFHKKSPRPSCFNRIPGFFCTLGISELENEDGILRLIQIFQAGRRTGMKNPRNLLEMIGILKENLGSFLTQVEFWDLNGGFSQNRGKSGNEERRNNPGAQGSAGILKFRNFQLKLSPTEPPNPQNSLFPSFIPTSGRAFLPSSGSRLKTWKNGIYSLFPGVFPNFLAFPGVFSPVFGSSRSFCSI